MNSRVICANCNGVMMTGDRNVRFRDNKWVHVPVCPRDEKPCPDCGNMPNHCCCPAPAPAEHQGVQQISSGFDVTITFYSKDVRNLLTHPEFVRELIGDMLDKRGIEEEIDYTLEVKRAYR